VLTAAEVTAWELSLRQPFVPEELRIAYIRHWVEKELLYQEALRKELHNDPWAAERIEEATQTILVARLLEQEYRSVSNLHGRDTYFIIWITYQNSSGIRSTSRFNTGAAAPARAMDALRENLQRGRQEAPWTGDPGALDQGNSVLEAA
jgi:hypothetical protein